MPWREVEPVIDPDVRNLCVRRYLGHPRGCPNYGKKRGCPPSAPLLGDVLDLSQPVYAIWNAFDLAAHVGRMRKRHPEWSRRQLVCCLYWQQGARKQLGHEAVSLALSVAGERCRSLHIVECPEACGVNITETMRRIGIELEWPPVKFAYQIALAGSSVCSKSLLAAMRCAINFQAK